MGPSSQQREHQTLLRSIILGIGVATTLVGAYRYLSNHYIVTVQPGYTAVIFTRVHRIVKRIVHGPLIVPGATSSWCMLSPRGDETFILIPSCFLSGNGRSGLKISVSIVQCAVGSSLIDATVALQVFVNPDDLHRYVSIHGSTLPHSMIATAVHGIFTKVLVSSQIHDPETLLSKSRRQRSFDHLLATAVMDSLWVDVGVRCLSVAVESVTESST